MPLRQTIGISLALLMASTGAMAKAPEKSTSYQSTNPLMPSPTNRKIDPANPAPPTKPRISAGRRGWPFTAADGSRYRHAPV